MHRLFSLLTLIIISNVASFTLYNPNLNPQEFHSIPFTSSSSYSHLAGQDSSKSQSQFPIRRDTLQIIQPTSAKAHSYAYALIIQVSVGTPAQTAFQILLDTGNIYNAHHLDYFKHL